MQARAGSTRIGGASGGAVGTSDWHVSWVACEFEHAEFIFVLFMSMAFSPGAGFSAKVFPPEEDNLAALVNILKL